VTRRPGSILLVGCLSVLALAGCGGDEPEPGGTAPIEVTEGQEFTWNDFTVEDGWEIDAVETTVGAGEVVEAPEMRGTVVNNAEEERAVLFQVVLSLEGDELARLNCSAAKLPQGQSTDFLCPPLGAIMPEEYDTLTVLPIRRDAGESGDESGT